MSWKIAFTPTGWEQYMFWQQNDKAMLKRINNLIKELIRHPQEGKGDLEMLKANFQGYWSRRIDKEHRLIYRIAEDVVEVNACRYHYEE